MKTQQANLRVKQREVDLRVNIVCKSITEHTLEGVPFRIEYPIDKGVACKRLVAHSFILRVIEAFLGPNFIPTWDSFVFKVHSDRQIIIIKCK